MLLTILIIVFAAYFYLQTSTKINDLQTQLKDIKALSIEYKNKYNNLITDYSELNQSYSDLSKSSANQIADLKLSLSNAESDFKSLEKSLQSLQLEHQKDLKEEIKKAREDTIKRSRSVLRGQASEHLAPFVIKDTNPKDYRFMGNPVDYICFDGLSDVLDKTSDEIKLVRFVDIKTGKSNLNKSQRRIRDAIKDSRVSFEIVNLDEVLNDNSTTKNETESKEKSKD